MRVRRVQNETEMAYQSFQQEYFQIPPITRAYTTACVLTTLAVQLNFVSIFQLYFNPTLILSGQVWRLVTTFLFFGTVGFNLLFNMIFTYRYCRMLEENSFRGRTADFFVMFVFGGAFMTAASLVFHQAFLGHAFTMMLVYIWGRRNPYVRMNFFGLMSFQAPYLPWVLLAFSVLFGNPIIIDLLGIAVGHIYFFLEDVFPHQQGGFKVIKTPAFLKSILEPRNIEDPAYEPLPEDRPGGYAWGQQQDRPADADDHPHAD